MTTLWLGVVGHSFYARFTLPGQAYLGTYSDDFFYYLVPAEAWLEGGLATFDGRVETNGFQPLWFAIVTLLRAAVGDSSQDFFVAISTLSLALLLLFLVPARRVCALLGAPAPLDLALALCWATYGAYYANAGMETALAMLLGAYLFQRLLETPLAVQRGLRAVGTGALAAAWVLTRIDAALVIVVLWLLTLIRGRGDGARPLPVGPFLVGLSPALAYFCYSRLHFGSWLPVSGVAKQLNATGLPQLADLRWQFFDGQSLALYAGSLVALGVTLVRTRSRPGPQGRGAVVAACLLAPPGIIGMHWVLSGWELLDWYRYAYPLAGAATWALLIAAFSPRLGRAAGAFVLVLVVGVFLVRYTSSSSAVPRVAATFDEARRLTEFRRKHPGRYAMGDRAGLFAFLAGPVVQTEGLVMDLEYLKRLRAGGELLPVLEHHDVAYYVSTVAHEQSPAPVAGCIAVREPMARVSSQRSAFVHDRLCMPPVLQFTSDYGTTRVWALAGR